MRKRIQMTAKRRTNDYYRLRYWWLAEIRTLKAKRRVNGINVQAQIKTAQRELNRVREEH